MAANSTAVNTCNGCKSHVKARWHCTVCDDFDLCIKCYTKDGHVHKMLELGLELGEVATGGDEKQIDPSKDVKIRGVMLVLEHAYKCEEANCLVALGCQKMKRLVLHAKTCGRRGSCKVCKQLIALNCYHAKECKDKKCPVLFCSNIKYKLKQRQMALKPPIASTVVKKRFCKKNGFSGRLPGCFGGK